MKNRRKSDHCKNCGLHLEQLHNFCPQCGQENTENRVSLRYLFLDLFANYLSLDTRMGRSILPLLFRPWELVNAFLHGQRLKYLPPVRLYIISSLFFFFAFSQISNLSQLNNLRNIGMKINSNDSSLSAKNNNTDEKGLRILDSLDALDADNINRADRLAKKQFNNKTGSIIDAIKDKKTKEKAQRLRKGDIENVNKWYRFVSWIENKNMTEKALKDSLKKTAINFNSLGIIAGWEENILKQLLKIGRNDLNIFLQTIINNIPLMMLIMLPLYASYMKFLYLFTKHYYVEHFVFTFYLQTFIYFLFGFAMLISKQIDYKSEEDVAIFVTWVLFISFLYALFMFKNVYRQGWLLTFVKINILSFLYVMSLILFLSIDLVYSFFMY